MKNRMKVTDAMVDGLVSDLVKNKSDDGVLMYAEGTFAVTDKTDAAFYINMMCVKNDPSRFGKAVDILAKKHPTDSDALESNKAGFNVIMGIEEAV